MRCRWGRIALLVFQAIWLNVIVPGHKRGIVPLPGSCHANDSCCAADGCDSEQAPGSHGSDAGGARHTPLPRDSASHCAICQFAARLTLPPVVDYVPPLLGLALVLDPPAPLSVESVRFPFILHDRAPPFVA